MKKSLLVQPSYPIPNKSKNHSNFLPIGLLKIATYLRIQEKEIINPDQLVWGERLINFKPKKIYVTSLFTYWSEYVEKTVKFYVSKFPKAKIIVGGILATLMPNYVKNFAKNINVFEGIFQEAEEIALDNGAAYDLADEYEVDYQIVHAMRGCMRKCDFCGTWRLEDRKDYDISRVLNNILRCGAKNIIGKKRRNKVIFYDNNLLANNHIEDLLIGLSDLRIDNKRVICESQSGFDGRIIRNKPILANLLKKARFINPRIAWDNSYSDVKKIQEQIEILKDAGYNSKEIYVFFLYNWEIPYEEMYMKVTKLWDLKVQIADCRFRPLNQVYDYYKPQAWRKGQSSRSYFIHPLWTDFEVRSLRKLVRWHNISIRHIGYEKYTHIYFSYLDKLNPKKIKKYKSTKDIIQKELQLKFSD